MCKAIVIVFGLAYLAALAILLIGTYGLFGQERDPLSAVFLFPLGLPWNLFLDPFPDAVRPWLAALSPALNLLMLRGVCRAISGSET
ncbi:hypothetical protein [Ostreiculturibacter nitratireducens]|uniref:hypothetical protein n=1 Tax=Ostreiculturibacter nitratireducens TaxID=3075226 RepID=UPI0031B5B05C